MFLKIILSCIAISSIPQLMAQEVSTEKNLESCIELNDLHTDKLKCIAFAEEHWKKEIKYFTNMILKNISGDNEKDFLEAEESWEEFKDAEIQMISNLKGLAKNQEAFEIIAADLKMRIHKARALFLTKYYNVLFM